MSDYKPVKGDRVRVTFEAEVEQVYSDGDLRFDLVDGYSTEIPHEGTFSIEKLEPPVEMFKPGDVVRWHFDPPWRVVALGRTGYVELPRGAEGKYDNLSGGVGWFTSERYEKVQLG